MISQTKHDEKDNQRYTRMGLLHLLRTSFWFRLAKINVRTQPAYGVWHLAEQKGTKCLNGWVFTLGERTGYHVEGKEHTTRVMAVGWKEENQGGKRKREKEKRINERLIVTCTEHKPLPNADPQSDPRPGTGNGFMALHSFSFSFAGFSHCSSRCYLSCQARVSVVTWWHDLTPIN